MTSPYTFVSVACEGPDSYAQAGGLATRLNGLTEELVRRGYQTHHVFFGDPELPGVEERPNGVVLHRWGQWISRYHPVGCYDGEENKLRDLERSLPPFLVDRIIAPAIACQSIPVVVAEEWQTVPFTLALDRLLRERRLRQRTIVMWNANNPYGFDRIDWPGLRDAALITTVSRFMKNIIRGRGVDAEIVPNGIPPRLLESPRVTPLAKCPAISERPFFFKMARWEREKGWDQALDAVATLRRRGEPVKLVARSGGPAGQGPGIGSAATARGLAIAEVTAVADVGSAISAIRNVSDADVIDLRFPVSEDLAKILFSQAGGVLANSISEPFGLVGLEAMAAGGIVFTGGTGEDYARQGHNAVVLQSTDPLELANRAQRLWAHPERVRSMRRSAQATAHRYTWDAAVSRLIKLVRRRKWELEAVADPNMVSKMSSPIRSAI